MASREKNQIVIYLSDPPFRFDFESLKDGLKGGKIFCCLSVGIQFSTWQATTSTFSRKKKIYNRKTNYLHGFGTLNNSQYEGSTRLKTTLEIHHSNNRYQFSFRHSTWFSLRSTRFNTGLYPLSPLWKAEQNPPTTCRLALRWQHNPNSVNSITGMILKDVQKIKVALYK